MKLKVIYQPGDLVEVMCVTQLPKHYKHLLGKIGRVECCKYVSNIKTYRFGVSFIDTTNNSNSHLFWFTGWELRGDRL